MSKLEKLIKEVAEKQTELKNLTAETRSAAEDETKSVDDVKAGMDHIDTVKADIEKLQADISVLQGAKDLPEEEPEEQRDEDDAVVDDSGDEPVEENAADVESEKPEVEKEDETEKRGVEDMKKQVVATGAENETAAFEEFLKTGEVRDASGLALQDGAVIIPETIMTPEHEQHQFPRLGNLVRKVAVSTTTGKLPVFMTSTDTLKAHTEYAPTDKGAKPEIKPILWDLNTYTGAYAFSQELISDSSYNWEAELRSRLVELRDNTDDSLIMAALTNGVTAVASSDPVSALKTALNVTLKPQDSQSASIILSQSAYDIVDQLVDGEGRPLLQPAVANATGYSILGKTVVIVDDNLFPKNVNAIVAPLNKAVINFKLAEITGQFQDTYDIWYKQLGIFLREDVVQARKDLIINLNLSKPAVTPTSAG
ncbi:phage major capsid protein [Weissella paramesenteroides]|uniref:phage major capsid protein n=1 Tax=Weissella paramesenteroides TaxID=1249 RepID=UPI0012391C17|nr:phage major capsid protein [Weissella paramesenteroides]KAA8446940.1 phage major capsid protein [Weissella paramesenteroides]KAA8450576.1 phage major capsid protein [Weissella paramesenteroides]